MIFINLQKENQGYVEKDWSYWVSIAFLALLTLELIFVPVFLHRNYPDLDKERNTKKCGYVYEDLNFKIRGKWALAYPVLYQLRFITLTIAIMFLEGWMVTQTLIVCISTLVIVTNHP